MRGRGAEPLVNASPTASLKRVEVCALSGEAPGAQCPHRVMEWMPPATAETLPTCQFHERVRVDRRNGLLAGPDCASSEVVDVPVEHFPPEYAAWAKAAGRSSLPVGGAPELPRAGDPSRRLSRKRAADRQYPRRRAVRARPRSSRGHPAPRSSGDGPGERERRSTAGRRAAHWFAREPVRVLLAARRRRARARRRGRRGVLEPASSGSRPRFRSAVASAPVVPIDLDVLVAELAE